ncbi:hypothetical protein C8035_v011541 [Colletotrichum spinosum]|uniref:Ig-like domain-containing protein n=1 Tax=Colletotrichum spinosum TaxID=1347390 RepID=A0A4R8Q9W8_9PEZI|nr:hypothetical protein C8035_v011541 [Colletotrichum spinosum]
MLLISLIVAICGLLPIWATSVFRDLQPSYIPGLEWEVQAFPSGPTLVLTGTHDEVHDQLLELNPSYDTDFPDFTTDTGSIDTVASFQATYYECETRDRRPAYSGRIRANLKWLRNKSGRPRVWRTALTCGRAVCDGEAAVYLCNVDGKKKTFENWTQIAEGVEYLLERCEAKINRGKTGPNMMAGIVHHKDNWAVEVRKDEEC